MRRLDRPEALQRISWVDPDPSQWIGGTGYDPQGWADSVWVLHAMFELADVVTDLTYDAARKADLASGSEQPIVVNGFDMEQDGYLTGFPLGFTRAPGPPWQRLLWAELVARRGLTVGAVTTAPPCELWFPRESWPVTIEPPPEGSLDEVTLDALLTVLTRHTSAEALRDCTAFFAAASHYDPEEVVAYAGRIDDIAELTVREDKSPSNLWPADRSWFVYTDWDLMGTRVSGSHELIEAMEADDTIETIRWQRGPRPTSG